MQKYDTIEITFKSGQSVVWRAGEWDAYARDGGLFIIAKDGNPIGFYSLDCVACIVVEKSAAEEPQAAAAPQQRHAEGASVSPGDGCRHAEGSQADLVECEVAVALPVEHGIRL